MMKSSGMLILFTLVFAAVPILYLARVRSFLRFNEKPSAAAWLLLLAVVAWGGWVRFDHTPLRFKVFYVEYEIYNNTRMIAGHGDFNVCSAGSLERCEHKEPSINPPGFSYLGAVAMKLTGHKNPAVLFRLNALLGLLAILAAFLLTAAATSAFRPALFAALFVAMNPLGIILSGNATTETADLLMLCVAFTFLATYLRDRDALSGLGLLFSLVAAVLVSPPDIFIAFFVAAALLWRRPHGLKEIPLAVAGAALLLYLFRILPPVYADALHPPAVALFNLLKSNARFLVNNVFVSSVFTVAGVAGAILLFKRAVHGAWLTLLIPLALVIQSRYGWDFGKGDFVRHMLIVLLPVSVYFGVSADWALTALKSPAYRNALVALCLVLFFVSAYNKSLLPLIDFMESQDDILAEYLPKTPRDCSVFSANASIPLAFVNNKSYDMANLLNGGFMKKHNECKIFISEVACASSQRKMCDRIARAFSPKTLFKDSVFEYYTVDIGRLNEGAPHPPPPKSEQAAPDKTND